MNSIVNSDTSAAEAIKTQNMTLSLSAKRAIEQIRHQARIYQSEVSDRIRRLSKIEATSFHAVFDPTAQLMDVGPSISDEDKALLSNPTKGLIPKL